MILTSTLACAVITYHEARGTYLSEQILVTKVLQNRATSQNMTLVDTMYQTGQFSSVKGIRKRLRFNNYKELLSYYNIDDLQSFALANFAL